MTAAKKSVILSEAPKARSRRTCSAYLSGRFASDAVILSHSRRQSHRWQNVTLSERSGVEGLSKDQFPEDVRGRNKRTPL